MRCIAFPFFVISLYCANAPLRADMWIEMVESGNDVVATISGSIASLEGLTPFQTGAASLSSSTGSVRPNRGTFSMFVEPETSFYFNNFDVPISPNNFGTGSTTVYATSGTVTASMFFRGTARNPQIWIDENYVLGTAVTGTLTWADSTFATLGMTNGSYRWAWTGDSVTLNINPIPEPSTYALALAGLACGGWHLRRRRRRWPLVRRGFVPA